MALRSTSAGRAQPKTRNAKTKSKRSTTEASVTTAFTGIRGSSLVFMILAIVGSLHALSMIGIETHRILVNAQEIERLDAEIAVIKEDIAAVNAVITHTDDVYMEQLARCQGFMFPNEARYLTYLPEEATQHLKCHSLP